MAVNLTKGQKVSLSKDLNGGNALGVIKMGLGWDTGSRDVDLDASCVLLGADKGLIDQVWFRQLKSKCGSIVHSGDNRTGAGDGDDEVISVDLNKVPANVQHIVFTVNSFLGQKFDVVENAFVRIVNGAGGAELCRFQLSAKVPNTAMIMSRLYRHNGEWKFAAIGDPADGRTVQDLAGAIARLF
jgi:tellurium resistance protein TerZ